MTARDDEIIRLFAAELAPELRQSPDQVIASIREAIDAGLLTVSRNGLRIAIPTDRAE